jgi:hypothetical protein
MTPFSYHPLASKDVAMPSLKIIVQIRLSFDSVACFKLSPPLSSLHPLPSENVLWLTYLLLEGYDSIGLNPTLTWTTCILVKGLIFSLTMTALGDVQIFDARP